MTLTRDDLYSLEDYAAKRADFRSRVAEHKKTRRVPVGAHVTIHFEDRLTMHYQIQEMTTAAKAGAEITVGIEHRDYGYENDLSPAIRASLVRDLH